MEDTMMNVIEEVVNNEENVVQEVVAVNGGWKDRLIGALLLAAGYVAVKVGKKVYYVILDKKAKKERVVVEAEDDVVEEVE